MDLFYRLFSTSPVTKFAPQTCWKEMLETALGGLRTTDQQIEHFIDRMERRS